jgi:pimeloyl-ACP methyl ester carboxylesterase
MRTTSHSPFPSSTSSAANLRAATLIFFSLCLLFFQTAFADSNSRVQASFPQDGHGFETTIDPAIRWFESQGLNTKDLKLAPTGRFDLHTPITLDHVVPLPDGGHLAVQETFTIFSWLRRPARAVLFLSGSVFRGNHWSIPVEGYHGTAMAAERGYFAFTVDYLGVGGSSIPADGLDVTLETNRQALKVLMRYIRFFRGVPRIDLVGEGYGGFLAAELGAMPNRVRSVSLAAMLYTEVTGGPLTDPNFVKALEDAPNGYFYAPGFGSLFFMAEAPQAARDYVEATQGGLYPVMNFLSGADLPSFDPSVARVPGLVIHGDLDFIAPADDIRQMADDYGNHGALYVSRPDAGHAPRIESPELADWFWQTIFDFLEHPH